MHPPSPARSSKAVLTARPGTAALLPAPTLFYPSSRVPPHSTLSLPQALFFSLPNPLQTHSLSPPFQVSFSLPQLNFFFSFPRALYSFPFSPLPTLTPSPVLASASHLHLPQDAPPFCFPCALISPSSCYHLSWALSAPLCLLPQILFPCPLC